MNRPGNALAVLITGAGTGLGLETSLLLAERGFRVYASVPDRGQEDGVHAAARSRGVSLRVLHLDVTRPETIQTAVEEVVSESGGIFGLVNSAGIGLRGFFEDLSEEEIGRLFDINVFGTMAATRAVLPYMRRARRGRVVMMTSAGGRIAAMTLAGYCSAKFAVEGFGEALSLEMASFDVDVSLVEPGLVLTPHFSVHRGRARAAVEPASPYYEWFLRHEKMVDDFLRTRRITPADVARAVHRALTDRRPKLRYVVGRYARLMIMLHKHLPAEMFRRIYARQVLRKVTRSAHPLPELSDGLDLGIPVARSRRATSVTEPAPGGRSVTEGR